MQIVTVGVSVHEEKGHGFADDVAAARDDGVGAFDLISWRRRISMQPTGVQATRLGRR